MHPLIMRELLDERVREAHQAAAVRQRARLARCARRSQAAATAVVHPMATLRSRRAIRGEHAGPLADGHAPRRAA